MAGGRTVALEAQLCKRLGLAVAVVQQLQVRDPLVADYLDGTPGREGAGDAKGRGAWPVRGALMLHVKQRRR